MKRRDKFDYVIVETTGLADPGPVAQTFFIDDDLRDHFQLDAIVTLVDAKHAERHLEEVRAASEQIAFADVVLLNKTDLVSEQDLARVEQRIRSINRTAQVFRTEAAKLPIERVLDVGAFDLDRALAVDKGFLEPEYPFEWAGCIEFAAGKVQIRTGAEGRTSITMGTRTAIASTTSITRTSRRTRASTGTPLSTAEGHVAHGHLHHSGLNITVLPRAGRERRRAEQADRARPARASPKRQSTCPASGQLEMGANLFRLEVGHEGAQFTLVVNEPGAYAVFCEHVPAEFALRFEGLKAAAERQFASHHHHDDEITSIGISDPRAARRPQGRRVAELPDAESGSGHLPHEGRAESEG